ncbi:MAG: 5'-3' exoribonuclease 2 [Icmadophila ericetorum]|nr:5'-3' exoribonuclease 2 [Icmadophila ericetorum]
MGIPAAFRWLSQKYPKIISPVIEELPQEIEGQEVLVDTAGPNPNGEEFDNLYLDMNAIVHPCAHPEDRPPPETEEGMMLEIFKYADRVVSMVRPRKILMMAVDGVAPRAKMNQQRSRRFRSAQEAKEKDEDNKEFAKMLRSQKGNTLDPDGEVFAEKKTWDSNAITPGTPFMNLLATSLRYWAAYKANTDPAWEKLKVIISDASVPGEGEHKIMEFIRSQRASPEHDPNTRHVMYGLDADLIMLGLATHEPHFRVLREDVFFQESKARTCRICGQTGHKAEECRGQVKVKQGQYDEKNGAVAQKPFIWLHVSILREYLEIELMVPGQPFRFDLERALDDWVFMCFFVGNDFLPHLPSLDIRENGIDTLMAIWRDNLPLMGGYVTKDGQVNLQRAQYILDGLAKQEDQIFRRRRQTEERKDSNAKRRRMDDQNQNNSRNSPQNGNTPTRGNGRRASTNPITPPPGIPLFAPSKGGLSREVLTMTHEMAVNRGAANNTLTNKSAAAVLKSQLMSQTSDSGVVLGGGPEGNLASPPTVLGKRKVDLLEEEDPSTPISQTPDGRSTPQTSQPEDPDPTADNVRLWEEGYADRYYEQKFKVDPKDIAFRNQVAKAYVEGLAWVLLYYFQGCPSWTWYYPYHYAPFAADFVDLEQMTITFDKGVPFKPYEQLMGVLPAASSHAIPEPFRKLMTDEDSKILDFYPEDFVVDLNGKKMAWQGVALLPFIDASRLLKAMGERYHLLSKEEDERNAVGKDALIFSTRHPLYEDVAANFYSKRQGLTKYKLNPRISEGLAGKVEKAENYLPQSSLICPLAEGSMPDLEEDRSISVNYEMPKSTHIHKSMLLRGVKFPTPVLEYADIEATRSRASQSGRSYGGAPLRGNYRGRGGGRGNSNGNYGSNANGHHQNSYGGGYSDSHAAQVGMTANGYQQRGQHYAQPAQQYANSYPPGPHHGGYNQYPPPPGTGYGQPRPPGTYQGNYYQRR